MDPTQSMPSGGAPAMTPENMMMLQALQQHAMQQQQMQGQQSPMGGGLAQQNVPFAASPQNMPVDPASMTGGLGSQAGPVNPVAQALMSPIPGVQ